MVETYLKRQGQNNLHCTCTNPLSYPVILNMSLKSFLTSERWFHRLLLWQNVYLSIQMLHKDLASCTVGGISANTKPTSYCITMNPNLGYISLMKSLEIILCMLKRRTNSAFPTWNKSRKVGHMSHSQPLVSLLANTQLHPHKLSLRLDILLSQHYYWSHGRFATPRLKPCNGCNKHNYVCSDFRKENMQFQQVCDGLNHSHVNNAFNKPNRL